MNHKTTASRRVIATEIIYLVHALFSWAHTHTHSCILLLLIAGMLAHLINLIFSYHFFPLTTTEPKYFARKNC